jgi:hypothetical protein
VDIKLWSIERGEGQVEGGVGENLIVCHFDGISGSILGCALYIYLFSDYCPVGFFPLFLNGWEGGRKVKEERRVCGICIIRLYLGG